MSSPDVHQRPDHVALELEFVAFLLEKHLTICHGRAPAVSENALTCRNALAAFLSDHAAWWMPTFGRCLERRVELVTNGMLNAAGRADIALLGGLARVLCAWVAAERSLFEIAPVCRLIGPEVPLPDAGDNACGTCAGIAGVKN